MRSLFCYRRAQIAVGNDDTLQAIVAQCESAMKPPIQMTIKTNGIVSRVYQKVLAGGIKATRNETPSPVEIVCITIGNRSFELFPSSKLAMDSTIVFDTFRSDAMDALSKFRSEDVPMVGEIDTFSAVDIDGRNCWKLTKKIPMSALDRRSISSSVLNREYVPNEINYYVDQTSGVVRRTETVSSSGRVLRKLEYLAIEQGAECSDDLFLIPDTYTLLEPTSLAEYVVLRKSMVSRDLPRELSSEAVLSELRKSPWEFKGDEDSKLRERIALSNERRRVRKADQRSNESRALSSVSENSFAWKQWRIAGIFIFVITAFGLLRMWEIKRWSTRYSDHVRTR